MKPLILLLLCLCGVPAQAQQNVIVIITDQLSEWATDPSERAPLELPNLDALADRGRRFTRCYTTSPVCAENRLALFSGRYPFQGEDKLLPGVPTLGTIFTAAGYDTGYIGKWHLSPVASSLGFVAPADRPGWRYFAGNEGAPHNYTSGISFKQASTKTISTAPWESSWTTNEAVRFLRTNRQRPFLLVVNYGPPHPGGGSYMPPTQLYTAAEITVRPNTMPGAATRYADYMSLAVTTDNELGVLLPEINLATTLVVFTADHGDLLFAHGAGNQQQKRMPWEEASHIPLILAGPGVDIGPDARLISTVDILPTLLRLTGTPIPDELQGSSSPGERPVYFGHDSRTKSWGGERWRGLVDGQFKYAVTESGALETLFELGSDPYELADLASDPEHAATLNSLRRTVRARARAIGDDFFR